MRRSSDERNVCWSEERLMELMWYEWALAKMRLGTAVMVSSTGSISGRTTAGGPVGGAVPTGESTGESIW